MGYKKPSYITQSWWVIKYAVTSWFEWISAKKWAKKMHRSWLEIAEKSINDDTRKMYRLKILIAYRESKYKGDNKS